MCAFCRIEFPCRSRATVLVFQVTGGPRAIASRVRVFVLPDRVPVPLTSDCARITSDTGDRWRSLLMSVFVFRQIALQYVSVLLPFDCPRAYCDGAGEPRAIAYFVGVCVLVDRVLVSLRCGCASIPGGRETAGDLYFVRCLR